MAEPARQVQDLRASGSSAAATSWPASAKVRKLKITVKKGTTFTVVKVKRLVKGKLRFTVKATKVGSGVPKVSLTTQVSQTRKH